MVGQKNLEQGETLSLSGNGSTSASRAQNPVNFQDDGEARFRQLFETMSEGFALHEILCDAAGVPVSYRFLEANPAFERHTGLKAAEIIGRTVHEVLPEIEPCWIEAFGRVALGGGSVRFEKFCETLGHHYEVFAYSPSPGQFACLFLDITERKRLEEELRLRADELAMADRRKDEFLAMLAHELRNPLAPIRNAIQVLRMLGSNDPSAVRQKDIIDRQVSHLARLVDDLLDVSRVTRGLIQLNKKPLPMDQVLAHAIETASPLIQSRRHQFTLQSAHEDLSIDGDLDRLAQAIGNLLVNAAKYTPEGGRIWLEATREEDQAVIRVRDTGMGIAPEMLPRIFDLFSQADQSLARTQGGLGIGLTLARSLVRMHGGAIEAHSGGPGQGSMFTVRLPLLPASPLPADAPLNGRHKKNGSQRRVLVVDDVVDSANSLAELIELWGCEVRVANYGTAALSIAREFRPEVVLLDIGMPGMDGYEVARRLRAEHGGKMLLVAQTGYGQDQDRQQALQAGFDEHMVKPVEITTLSAILSFNPD